jgi:hypothetical protein
MDRVADGDWHYEKSEKTNGEEKARETRKAS